MGSEKSTTKKLPKGINIRTYSSGREVIYISFNYNRQTCRETLGIDATPANIKYAERFRSMLLLEIQQGTFNFAERFPNSKNLKKHSSTRYHTKNIRELARERLEYIERRGIYEASTLSDRWKKFHNHIDPIFGDMFIADLKASHITEWIKQSDLGRSATSTVLSLINPLIKEAMADGVVSTNPIQLVDYNQLFAKATRKKAKEKIDPLNEEDIRLVLNEARTEAGIFAFALFSGVRRQELPLIKWENIDWNRSQLLLDEAIGLDGNNEYLKATKTNEERLIDLLPPAFNAIKRQKANTMARSEYVFLDPRTDKPYMLKSLYFFWKTTLRRAGVRYRSVKQTRHTFASLMLSKGENPMWVANQLGHADLTMLRDHYGKWIAEANDRGYVPKNDWNCTVSAPKLTKLDKAQ